MGALCREYNNCGIHTICIRLTLPITEIGSLNQAVWFLFHLVNDGSVFRVTYSDNVKETLIPNYLKDETKAIWLTAGRSVSVMGSIGIPFLRLSY